MWIFGYEAVNNTFPSFSVIARHNVSYYSHQLRGVVEIIMLYLPHCTLLRIVERTTPSQQVDAIARNRNKAY